MMVAVVVVADQPDVVAVAAVAAATIPGGVGVDNVAVVVVADQPAVVAVRMPPLVLLSPVA